MHRNRGRQRNRKRYTNLKTKTVKYKKKRIEKQQKTKDTKLETIRETQRNEGAKIGKREVQKIKKHEQKSKEINIET